MHKKRQNQYRNVPHSGDLCDDHHTGQHGDEKLES